MTDAMPAGFAASPDLYSITVTKWCTKTPGCAKLNPCPTCRDDLSEAKMAAARAIGARHRAAGIRPYGDLAHWLGDDMALMAVLGETTPTTEDNWNARNWLLDAYISARDPV